MKMVNIIKKMIKNIIFKNLNIMDDINKMRKYKNLEKKYKDKKLLRKIFSVLTWKKHDKIFLKYSCEIIPDAKIGKVIFRHPLGIVIGGGAIIEDGVIIHQNVTLGALNFDLKERRGIICNQIIGENTIICAGAKVLGDVKIGKNCIIGANAIVTKDIPDNTTVVGYNKIILKNKVGDKSV